MDWAEDYIWLESTYNPEIFFLLSEDDPSQDPIWQEWAHDFGFDAIEFEKKLLADWDPNPESEVENIYVSTGYRQLIIYYQNQNWANDPLFRSSNPLGNLGTSRATGIEKSSSLETPEYIYIVSVILEEEKISWKTMEENMEEYTHFRFVIPPNSWEVF